MWPDTLMNTVHDIFVAEAFTDIPGEFVPLADTLKRISFSRCSRSQAAYLRDERLQRRTDGGFDQVGSLLPDHDRRGIGIPVHNGGKNLNVKRILLGI